MRNVILVVLLLGLSVGCGIAAYPSGSYQSQAENTTFVWHAQLFSAEQLNSLGINFTSLQIVCGNGTGQSIVIEFASIPSEETLTKIDALLPDYIREGSLSIREILAQHEARIAALES